MNRTSTIRTTAAALAFISSVASISAAQYRTTNTFARAAAMTRDTSTTARDSSAAASKQPSARGPNTFYIGFGAGASMPSGQFRNVYKDGWSATVPLGWRPANGPLGMRADIAYSKWGGETVDGVKLGSAAVWDGMLDATLDMPFGTNKTSSFYLLGGGGVHYFPKYGSGSSSTATPGDTTTTTPPPGGYPQVNYTTTTASGSSTTRLGLNGGAGLSFGLPQGSALFIESRYVTVFTKNQRTNYWPLVGGIRWTMR
jgi:hypothetical protein